MNYGRGVKTEEDIKKLKRLRHISRNEWVEIFGRRLGLGFPIWIRHLPMIERCIEKRDESELIEYFKKANEKGIKW